MNKKILYGTIILSIFLISTASTLQPVAGYEFGVPNEAKGMEAETEVKIYDEDEWEDHIGKDSDEPDDIYDGDADIVGAKQKVKIIDWEEDEEQVGLFMDFLLKDDLPENDFGLDKYEDGISFVYQNVQLLSYNDTVNPFNSGPLTQLLGIAFGGFGNPALGGDAVNQSLIFNISQAFNSSKDYPIDLDYVDSIYGEDLDGTIMEADIWDFTEEAYENEPDMDDEEIPFAADPRDWYEMYRTLRNLKNNLFNRLGSLILELNTLRADLAQAKGEPWPTGDNPIGWKILNDTLAGALAGQGLSFPYADYPDMFIDALLNETGQNPLQLALNSGPGLNIIIPYFDFVLPDKKNFLYLLLKKGVPTYAPVDDFLHRMLEDFDIDGDDYYDVPHVPLDLLQELGGVTVKAQGDVELDGTSITMEFEYKDNQKDPSDLEEELDDWEVTFTFSEYGFQSSVSYKDDDGEEFYRKESLQTIPGFEVTILLGVSAVSIIGVIYVVMKKRKK